MYAHMPSAVAHGKTRLALGLDTLDNATRGGIWENATFSRHAKRRYDARGAQAEVAEWQTRRSQTPLRATSSGFESRLRHHPYC
jgi:hypothetical protein